MDSIIIIEHLRFLTLVLNIFKKKIKINKISIYYIHSNPSLHYFRLTLFGFLGLNVNKLEFKMIDIRGKNNQICSLLIPNEELFKLEHQYKDKYKIFSTPYSTKNIDKYILKKIFAFNYHQNSPFRTIYLIDVINYKFNLNKSKKKCYFILDKKIGYDLYNFYSNQKSINILIGNSINEYLKIRFLTIINLIKIFKNNLKFIYLKNFNINNIYNERNKLFCEGKSQPHLILNGDRSDFHWLLSSNFDPKNTLYNCTDKKDVIKLNNFGIKTTFKYKSNTFIKKKYFNYSDLLFNFFNNSDYLNSLNNAYDFEYLFNKWINYFKTHNVKIFLNWYKYDASHIPMHEAINELGGISSFFQPNFDGMPFYECKLISDVSFCHSKFSTDLDKINQSQISYNLITGYPSTPITKQMINKASKIRSELKNHGAQKIICVLDENSLPDARWHTGDNLQIENYTKILEQFLTNDKLGLIFKPKSAYDLKRRLKYANKILDKAIKTGRCIVLNETETNDSKFTKATPSLAALASDLVIHSHLCAGTAAIETALLNKPTILIDRECAKNSIFHKILEKINIYSNWDDAIYAINDNFINSYNEKFGNWKNTIHFFDPFLDNKGSYRIGEFLNEIIKGYDNKEKKDIILAKCMDDYCKKWGKDKLVY